MSSCLSKRPAFDWEEGMLTFANDRLLKTRLLRDQVEEADMRASAAFLLFMTLTSLQRGETKIIKIRAGRS